MITEDQLREHLVMVSEEIDLCLGVYIAINQDINDASKRLCWYEYLTQCVIDLD